MRTGGVNNNGGEEVFEIVLQEPAEVRSSGEDEEEMKEDVLGSVVLITHLLAAPGQEKLLEVGD